MIDPAAELGGMGGGVNGPDMPPVEPTPAERLAHVARLVDKTPLTPDLETSSSTFFDSPATREELAGQLEGVTTQIKDTLDPTQRPFVDEFQQQVRDGKINKDDVLAGLRDYKNRAAQAGAIDPAQMEQANELLASLHTIDDPSSETGFKAIKDKLGQFSKIFKTAGALFIAVIGLGVFKAFKTAQADMAPSRQ